MVPDVEGLVTFRAIEKSDLPELKSFEVAQLGTLCPADVDEAKALIPR